jgi:hypothetical protein
LSQNPGLVPKIGPVIPDQRQIDGAFAKTVGRAAIGFPVDPPRPGVTRIVQPPTELVAKIARTSRAMTNRVITAIPVSPKRL